MSLEAYSRPGLTPPLTIARQWQPETTPTRQPQTGRFLSCEVKSGQIHYSARVNDRERSRQLRLHPAMLPRNIRIIWYSGTTTNVADNSACPASSTVDDLLICGKQARAHAQTIRIASSHPCRFEAQVQRVPGDRRRLHVEAPWEHNQEPLLAGTLSHGQCHHRDLGTNGEVASPRIVARQRPAAQCIAVH